MIILCVCACVCSSIFLSAELVCSSILFSAMAKYRRMHKKGPGLLSASMKQTLCTLRAARGVKPDTLCGARCSATLECISSMNIVQCRSKCVKNCFECYGSILGDHTCSMLSEHDFPDHDFPDFVAVDLVKHQVATHIVETAALLPSRTLVASLEFCCQIKKNKHLHHLCFQYFNFDKITCNLCVLWFEI